MDVCRRLLGRKLISSSHSLLLAGRFHHHINTFASCETIPERFRLFSSYHIYSLSSSSRDSYPSSPYLLKPKISNCNGFYGLEFVESSFSFQPIFPARHIPSNCGWFGLMSPHDCSLYLYRHGSRRRLNYLR